MADIQKQVWQEILKKASEFTMQANDPALWAKTFLGKEIYNNQVEIIKNVCNLAVPYLTVIGSRGGGKTYGVCVGLIKMCIDHPGLEVGLFGPRADQATRLISESRTVLANSKLHDQVDWEHTTTSRLVFMNKSYMLALSAAETSQQEGWHFDVVVCDESHRISNIAMTQRILPMLGSKKIFKLIKIGIPLYKNHFYESYCDSKFKIVEHNWVDSPILLRPGFKEVDGKKYPSMVLDRMPLALKQKMFPNNPELHYDGDMTDLEFQTQYNMTWVDDLNTFLSGEEQEKLLGNAPVLHNKQSGEVYYFGLDTASGTLLPGKGDLDFTALSIWRKSTAGIKEKIACYEWQGGETLSQIKEAMDLVHPITGLFPCAFGCVDYSNVGITAVEMFKNSRIPVAGILFSSTEPSSHKNYKNAMAHQFKFELQSNRVKYPALKDLDQHKVFRKHYYQWCALEKHSGVGINDQIAAPKSGGYHDDGFASDILAVWAADKGDTFGSNRPTYSIPSASIGRSVFSKRLDSKDDQGKKYL